MQKASKNKKDNKMKKLIFVLVAVVALTAFSSIVMARVADWNTLGIDIGGVDLNGPWYSIVLGGVSDDLNLDVPVAIGTIDFTSSDSGNDGMEVYIDIPMYFSNDDTYVQFLVYNATMQVNGDTTISGIGGDAIIFGNIKVTPLSWGPYSAGSGSQNIYAKFEDTSVVPEPATLIGLLAFTPALVAAVRRRK
jgi:hypothetical protein